MKYITIISKKNEMLQYKKEETKFLEKNRKIVLWTRLRGKIRLERRKKTETSR